MKKDSVKHSKAKEHLKQKIPKQKNTKPKKATIIIKLLALGLLPLLVLDLFLTITSTNALKRSMKNEIENSCKYVSASLIETYTNLYPGDYTTDASGGIYKGTKHISNDTRLVDSIKESAGFDCTLYFNGMRIITTITKQSNGGRAIATSPDEKVRQSVEFEGNTYFSDSLEIEGVRYYAYYSPLCDNDGTIVGMVFTGKAYDVVQAQIQTQINHIVLLSIVFILISGLITAFVSMKLSKTMIAAKDFLSGVSSGDLTATLPNSYKNRKDEIGQIFNKSVALQEQLKSIVSQMKASTNEMVNSSDILSTASASTDQTIREVSNAMSEIAGQAQTQATQTQTASDNIAIIGSQMESITMSVDSLAQTSATMASAETTSTKILQLLTNSNDQTIESVDKIAKQTDITNHSAQEIQKAVGLIQSIAEETDLLSLNASIEAARAGSAGLGFSVVAEQIRKLADQSRASASEIESIILRLLQESNTTVDIMKEVKSNIDHQQECLVQTKENFSAISSGIKNSTEHVNGIKEKIHQLNDSKNIIVNVIDTLTSLSQESAAVTEQTSASMNELDTNATNLAASSKALKGTAYQLEEQLSIFKI